MSQRWTELTSLVRRRIRRMVILRGLAWMTITLVAVVGVASSLDWTLHLESWTRCLLVTGIGGVSLAVLWKGLLSPLLVHLSEVDIARLIEGHLRHSDEGISSAAQFRASNHDSAFGSPELQQLAIAKADREIQSIDVGGLFAKAPVRGPLLAAALLSLIAALVIIAAPAVAWTALNRLATPFAHIDWPRSTRLRLLSANLNPLGKSRLRSTAGDPFPIYVENELGKLPDDITLDLRLADGAEQRKPLRTTVLRDTAGISHDVGIITLQAYHGPIHFRVWGGDDSGTDWRRLDIVSAPSLASVTITLTPPAYSGQTVQFSSGAGLVEGLVGSKVIIQGKTEGAISAAALHREHETVQPMQITDKGRGFRVEFVISDPGLSWYWFELTDEHGLSESDPPRYELRGIADRPPVVYIDEPTTDLTVTPTATIPLRVVVRDDIGLSALRLQYTDQPIADPSGKLPTDVPTIPLTLSKGNVLEDQVETDWQLESLGLSSGTTLTYWVRAIDGCDLETGPDGSPGQIGTSGRREFFVIEDSEKQRELAARQSGILDRLEALRDRQARARDTTVQLRIQSELAGRLQSADLDLLKRAELEQQEIHRDIADQSVGLAGEIEGIQQERIMNSVDDEAAHHRLELLANDLSVLNDQWFPVAEQALARARKSVSQQHDGSPASDTSDPDDSHNDGTHSQLKAAEEAQDSALALLAASAELLGGWRERFQLRRELDTLITDQKGIQQETKTVGSETMAKAASRLSAQQQADLARLSERQRRLASHLEQLLNSADPQSTEQTSSNSESQKIASGDVQDAQAWLQKQGTVGQMHQAAESLKRNEIPAAAKAQDDVMTALRDFGLQLQQMPLDDPESMLSNLQEDREQIESLRKQQETLARSSQQALSPTADPERETQLQRLQKQQSGLADEARDLANGLSHREQSEAAHTAERAARRMRDAHTALEEQQPEDVAINQQEALDDLDQLANELDSLQQRAEEDLAHQRMQQLADTLNQLADEQHDLTEATSALDEHHKERGSWSRSLRRELREIVEGQESLRTQLDNEQTIWDEIPVVRAAISRTVDAMTRAVALLDDEVTDEFTVRMQQEAEERLRSMAAVIGATGEDNAAPPSGSQALRSESQAAKPELQLTTQLKLLRQLQQDILDRTRELASRKEQTPESETIQAAEESLAKEQAAIAELSRTLLQDVLGRLRNDDAQAAPQSDDSEKEQP